MGENSRKTGNKLLENIQKIGFCDSSNDRKFNDQYSTIFSRLKRIVVSLRNEVTVVERCPITETAVS